MTASAAQNSQLPLRELVRGRKVVALVGSGGVGKTTSAAALALRLAVDGQRVLVLTIDPARRLANSLGLSALGNKETPIDLSSLRARGIEPRGQLSAMMLDLKTAWDELVRKDSRSPAQAEAILKNRLYQTVSTVLAGSLEYMAMEQVQRISASGRYDVVVLDTPPTSNALDFLGAPDRLMDMLDNDAMRFVLGPMLKAGSFGLKLFALPSSIILKTLARFTGADFLRDVADFFVAFEGMYEGFTQRAAQVKALLASPESAFVLVTSPSALTIDEALFFHRALSDARIKTAAVIVNRMQRDPRAVGGAELAADLVEALSRAQIPDAPAAPAALHELGAVESSALDAKGGELLSARLARTLLEQAALADVDHREVARLTAALPGVPLYVAPRLRRDIHDLSGLWQIHESLGAF